MPRLVMPIDTTFEIPGRGTVAVGTIERGSVEVGDAVRLATREARCLGIERYRTLLESAGAGDTVGVLLAGVTPDEVDGQVLRTP